MKLKKTLKKEKKNLYSIIKCLSLYHFINYI